MKTQAVLSQKKIVHLDAFRGKKGGVGVSEDGFMQNLLPKPYIVL